MLPRDVDMTLTGGRQEIDAEYEVAVSPGGQIAAMKLCVDMAQGSWLDWAHVHASMLAGNLDNVYKS